MYGTRPENDEIESLLKRAEGSDWSVVDWTYTTGGDSDSQIEMTIQYTPDALQEDTKTVLSIVRQLEAFYEDGAPADEVLETATDEYGLTADDAADELESLRRKGDVYEPMQGYLRST